MSEVDGVGSGPENAPDVGASGDPGSQLATNVTPMPTLRVEVREFPVENTGYGMKCFIIMIAEEFNFQNSPEVIP